MSQRGLVLALALLCSVLGLRSARAQPAEVPPASPPTGASAQPAEVPPAAPADSGAAQPAEVPPVPAPAPRLRPKVSILSTTRASGGTLLLEVEVVSPSGEQVQLRPQLNGQPISRVSIAQARTLALAKRYTVSLVPPAKEGVLSVTAQSGDVQSDPAMVRLRAGAPERRPALYVLAVGVSEYKSKDIPRLLYPGKDARDLATTLQRQRDRLYREIHAQVLADGQASLAGVMAGLDWLRSKVTTEDTAVIFLAGHGTNDTEGGYYFLPFDAQADKATMLSGRIIQAVLRGIAGRVILLLDTCHSGNVLGRSSLNRLINELTTENRVVVFAASTGDQTARESAAWQNGAFTKALVEGLRGVADYADDGELSMSELETWAGVRVRKLTGGLQTPTLAKPNAAPDYVLAALPLRGRLPNPKQVVRRRFLAVAGGILGAVILTVAIAVAAQTVISQQNTNVVDLSFR